MSAICTHDLVNGMKSSTEHDCSAPRTFDPDWEGEQNKQKIPGDP